MGVERKMETILQVSGSRVVHMYIYIYGGCVGDIPEWK